MGLLQEIGSAFGIGGKKKRKKQPQVVQKAEAPPPPPPSASAVNFSIPNATNTAGTEQSKKRKQANSFRIALNSGSSNLGVNLPW